MATSQNPSNNGLVMMMGSPSSSVSDECQMNLALGLSTLAEMGFRDDFKLNSALLKKHSFNMGAVVNALFEMYGKRKFVSGPSTSRRKRSKRNQNRGTSAAASQAPSTLNTESTETPVPTHGDNQDVILIDESETEGAHVVDPDFPDPTDLECRICFEEYSSKCIKKVPEGCGHYLCGNCYKKLENTGTRMSGEASSFFKCPVCCRISGIQIGFGPDSTMGTRKFVQMAGIRWTRITYKVPTFPDKVAFLPDSPEGNQVLKLLKLAFEFKLTFKKIDETTQNLQWNIPHKTDFIGVNGYPDPNYFTLVRSELAKFGIKD